MSARHTATPVDPSSARKVANDILRDRRFRGSHTPRPLRKPLDWLGDRLHGVLDWFGRVLSHVPLVFVLAVALAAVVLAVVFVMNRVRAQRGSADARTRGALAREGESEDPDTLERAADTAEREGRLDEAVRLRFRAGLLRLGHRGAIRYRPSVTTNEVRRVLGSDAFDELARTFDAIAYGGRDAAPPDVDAARREWPRVVSAAASAKDDRRADE